MRSESRDPFAVVLGASSGIGAAALSRLRCRGTRAVGLARRRLESDGGWNAPPMDVRDRASVRAAFNVLPGPIEVIVNCVGVGYFAPWDGLGEREWAEMAATNVAGLANVLSVVGTLVPAPLTYLHIGSLAAHRASNTPGNAVYTATKVAVRVLLTDFRRWSRSSGRPTRVMTLSPTLVSGTDFDRNFFRADESCRIPLYERPHLEVDSVADVILFMLDLPLDLEVSELVLRHRLQED